MKNPMFWGNWHPRNQCATIEKFLQLGSTLHLMHWLYRNGLKMELLLDKMALEVLGAKMQNLVKYKVQMSYLLQGILTHSTKAGSNLKSVVYNH